MKHSDFYREELPEPLRSLIEDLASVPVPEELQDAAKQFSVPASRPKRSRRSGLAVLVPILAMSLCIAALVVHKEPAKDRPQLTKKTESIPSRQTETVVPPTLWAYRQALSEESLEELLSQHAAILLQTAPWEDYQPFQPFSRKEEL